MKIARSEDSGISMVCKYDQTVESGEKLSSFHFLTLSACHERYKSYVYVGQPH